MQNDYSLVNRRVEENGLSEASSSALENCGFMADVRRSTYYMRLYARRRRNVGICTEKISRQAYNVLAGGMLTGKYGLGPDDSVLPAAVDDGDRARAQESMRAPRGRMDTRGWGQTLGRYRTTAARSAAAQYGTLASTFGIKSPTELALRFAASRPAASSRCVEKEEYEKQWAGSSPPPLLKHEFSSFRAV